MISPSNLLLFIEGTNITFIRKNNNSQGVIIMYKRTTQAQQIWYIINNPVLFKASSQIGKMPSCLKCALQ